MKRSWPRPLSALIAASGIVLTVVLSLAAASAHAHTNRRLLEQQVAEAGSVLTNQVAVVNTEMADIFAVVTAAGGSGQVFKDFVQRRISVSGLFRSISLWKITNGVPQRIALEGAETTLESQHLAVPFLSHVHPSGRLFVTPVMNASSPSLGYAEMPPGDVSGLVVYAERAVPGHKVRQTHDYPLRLAVYLGTKPEDSQLLETTAPVPIKGRTVSTSVPFGDTVMTVVGAPRTDLAGGVSAALPWIVLGVGLALALTSASTVEYVSRRRMVAERLATENRQLYLQQRDIAVTLQHALLPDLPTIGGIELASRYVAGVAGTDVGGDWYDVIATSEDRFVFVVGDVSGRGLRAATAMASLRYAIRAYVAQGDDVAGVLMKLHGLLDTDDGQFATILLGEFDIRGQCVTLVSAGHFFPLLITPEAVEFVDGHVETPVGLLGAVPATVVRVAVPPDATLLAFTDGLVERKNESLDIGLKRLRDAASRAPKDPLNSLLDNVMSQVIPADAADDVVVLAVRCNRT